MSGAGIYSPENYEPLHAKYTLEQCKRGGMSRARDARRDIFGRFLPKDHDLTLPNAHGRAGGLARARNAKRINGRFAKND